LVAQGNGGSCDAAQEKTCAAKGACGEKVAGQCAGAAKACAKDGACCGKGSCGGGGCGTCADGEVAATTSPNDCAGCAPMANWAKTQGEMNVDSVRIAGGVALLFTTGDADRVADLQNTVLTVNGNMGRAVSSAKAPEGLCAPCTKLITLAKSGVKMQTEKISTGALVVLTSSDASTVRSLHAWADGLKQSATAMNVSAPHAG
jgi:hypothetical protein